MNINYRKREIFLLRFSGWFCLLPATVYLYFYQLTNSLFCLGELVIIVLFAVYLLTTAKSKRWLNPQNVMKLTIFALIFVAIIILSHYILHTGIVRKYSKENAFYHFILKAMI